ncbi:proline--tRNA ligase [candidate division WWE3 bacterium]|nr:proline--tRNA ligase [candidate division WWE3 bacterium]
MALEKRNITSQKESFAKWYQDVVREAELAENSDVRGCGIVKPYGFKIWKLIKEELSRKIDSSGVEEVYFPMFIPLSNLNAEAAHVEGFSPELAVVTHGGGKELEEPLAVRPTSESSMYPTFGKWIQSYRDLPLRVNQWNNVVRWEKRPRPFLRWSEFLWQEGHTAFATEKAARKEVREMLEMYKDLYEYMAIPSFIGRKSTLEKFAGAEMTTTVELMVRDGKAIQGATSHYLGTNFAKVFDVQYLGEDGDLHYCHQNSWGLSWRSVGAVIMAHGDDSGLRLPPNIAPIQVVIVPIYKEDTRSKVLEFAENLKEELSDFRVAVDLRDDQTPGFKFNHWEVKGVPLRLEVGAREIDEGKITVFRRDLNAKTSIPLVDLSNQVEGLLKSVYTELFKQAKDFSSRHIHRIESIDDINDQVGFFEASWCESVESEKLLKEKFSMVSRVLPREFEDKEPKNEKCFITGEPAKHDWLFAKSY